MLPQRIPANVFSIAKEFSKAPFDILEWRFDQYVATIKHYQAKENGGETDEERKQKAIAERLKLPFK